MGPSMRDVIKSSLVVYSTSIKSYIPVNVVRFDKDKRGNGLKKFKKWFYSQDAPKETYFLYDAQIWCNVVIFVYNRKLEIGLFPTAGYMTRGEYDFFIRYKFDNYSNWNLQTPNLSDILVPGLGMLWRQGDK